MTRISIPDSVVFKQVGDELVLLDFERGFYYGLSEVGVRFWELLGRGLAKDEIVGELYEEYDVDREQLANDLDALIADLAANGLIVTTEDR